MTMGLQESAHGISCVDEDLEGLFESFNLRLALCLAFGIWNNSVLTSRLKLLCVRQDGIHGLGLLSLVYGVVACSLCQRHDLGLRRLDLHLLGCQGDLVLLRQLLVRCNS